MRNIMKLFWLAFLLPLSVLADTTLTYNLPTDFGVTKLRDFNTKKFKHAVETASLTRTLLRVDGVDEGDDVNVSIDLVFSGDPPMPQADLDAIQGASYPSPVGGLIAAHNPAVPPTFEAADVEASTTQQTWKTAETLTTDILNGNYDIDAMAEVSHAGGNRKTQVRLQNVTDGVTLAESEPPTSAGGSVNWHPFRPFAQVSFSDEVKVFEIQYRLDPSGNGNATAKIRRARIRIRRSQ